MIKFNSQVSSLLPNGSFVLSQSDNLVCSVERSSDGKKLRFVRTFSNGSFVVVKETDYTLYHYIKPNEIDSIKNTRAMYR
jgi:hypothetical protein